ncbi:MAG: dTDP-4-amino-4,6-dideoxygalactose transaminase [Polyangiaceae bacterium]
MIPFNRPVWFGTEAARLTEAIRDNGHVAAGGPFAARCEGLLGRQFGRPTLLTSSCTHALEMAALLLGIAPGDEVIVPSFTFVSTANAFALRGARLTFVDVDASGNVDVDQVAAAMGPRTRAVVAVHYAGNSCDLPRLLDVCGAVPLIEDAAQAIGASFAGRPLGTFGALATVSFHETKNVGCGEGGALVVNRPEDVDRARVLRDKGTNRQNFLSGEVDKYTWTSLGSSFGLSDLNAAYLLSQLECQDRLAARRRALHGAYADALTAPLERIGGYVVRGRAENGPNHHLFGMVFGRAEERTRFIAHMARHGIVAPFHYVGLHLSPMGEKLGESPFPMPNTERLATCLVRLPLHFNLGDHEQERVIAHTLEFLHGV